jgi:hypothetical protein
MAYGKWKPSKTKAKEYAEQMGSIQTFCDTHGISYSRTMDSYYFTLNGQKYRVSNHTIKASNSKAYHFDELSGQYVKVRDEYHDDDESLICFTASKTRLPEIYNALLAGKELDKRGYTK